MAKMSVRSQGTLAALASRTRSMSHSSSSSWSRSSSSSRCSANYAMLASVARWMRRLIRAALCSGTRLMVGGTMLIDSLPLPCASMQPCRGPATRSSSARGPADHTPAQRAVRRRVPLPYQRRSVRSRRSASGPGTLADACRYGCAAGLGGEGDEGPAGERNSMPRRRPRRAPRGDQVMADETAGMALESLGASP